MTAKSLSRELAQEAVDAWFANDCSRREAAQSLRIPLPTFESRLKAAKLYGIIGLTDSKEIFETKREEYGPRHCFDVESGVVIIGSDAHFWPWEKTPKQKKPEDRISVAYRAFLKLIKELQPKAVIMNGDVFDLPTVSRFSPIGWEGHPDIADEIEECQIRLAEAIDASPKAKHIWNFGNHDARFETRLASVAPQYARVKGVHLRDHFPEWTPAWSAWINDDVVVKHRFKGGVHATHNNTVNSGKTMVTGHLHSLKVTPFTDYNGTRYGVDTGTLAGITPMGEQFSNYLEDNPVNWRAGFSVLTFHKGKLLWPEQVSVYDGRQYQFRGKVYRT